MDVKEFDYNLPDNLIAQTPLSDRTSSKLLVLDRENGEIEHKHFKEIIDYLKEGDVLVVNDSRVIPARLFGVKEDTLAKIEVLLLHQRDNDEWECLVKPAKRVKMGTVISFGDGRLKARCCGIFDDGIRHFKMEYQGVFLEVLESLGEMPLPPYIREKLKDKERYQTVYSKVEGSAAAPTAGLHFNIDLLEKIKSKGVKIVSVTLHVGLGTFRPVAVENVLEHDMHSEFYTMSKITAETLNSAKKEGRNIISVGTTSTRVLETVMHTHNVFVECNGWTNIFIYPGFTFKAIDALITNFHLPKSTLMMLISAFASKEKIMKAYKEAVDNEYRFFSFGDSMLIK